MVLVPKVTTLFNMSLRMGIIPKGWKEAAVIPLHKGGAKSDVNNLRPISLLPVPGKLLERIVHGRVMAFLERVCYLNNCQGGFRQGHSTVSTISIITNDIYEAINNKQVTHVVFIDLKKAFDTVDHQILLSKIENAGIRNNTLSWIGNSLLNRKQHTVMNGSKSSPDAITSGAPQGSVLGPLLFLIYINDLSGSIGETRSQLFADDTVLYASDKDSAIAVNKLQLGLNKFAHWCNSNKLTINAKKTKHVIFGTKAMIKKADKDRLIYDNVLLVRETTYKYLGVTLDATLSMSKHISNITKQISHKVYVLGKISKYINYQAALTIYKTMILPYFDYGDIFYMNANEQLLNKLPVLQNKCLRTCLNLPPRSSTLHLHREANVANLKIRRRWHLRNFMFRMKENESLVDERGINTRTHDAINFIIKQPRCEKYKSSVYYLDAPNGKF